MDEVQFQVYCNHVGLDKSSLKCDLETLNLVLIKQITSVPYRYWLKTIFTVFDVNVDVRVLLSY